MAITISGDSPNFSSATITSGTITTGTVTTLNAPSGVLATQNGMTGIAKAWISYNGSTSTIRASYNITSVTVNGTGDYTFNFTTAMPDANYSVSGTCRSPAAVSGYALQPETYNTTSCRIVTLNSAVTQFNPVYVNVTFNGN